ncbi:hypothetical protein HHI36_000412 [Cryptolaemus montrouzieri]|uniref:Ionotropic receptor n=1 Tax=Cryptolaemus montrouzieri TaxID=559131 RepID=A0ABD2P4K1_9CUCU
MHGLELHTFLPFLQCVSGILKNYTSTGNYIAVVNSEYNFDIPVVRIQGSHIKLTSFMYRKFDFYVIDLDKTNIAQFLQIFHEDGNFHAGNKFLCIGRNISSNILESLSYYYIVNAIFLDSYSGILKTFFPFEKANLHKVNTNLQVIGKCSDTSRLDQNNLFPNKLPEKWTNSTITFCQTSIEPLAFVDDKKKGIGTEIYRLILKTIGATPNRTMIEFDNSNRRQEFIKQIFISRTCDFYVAGYPDKFFELTIPYYIDGMYWFVPSPAMNKNYNFIFGIFSTSVWLVWLASILCIAWCWYVPSHSNRKGQGLFFEEVLLCVKLVLEQTVKLRILRKTNFILYTIIIFSTFMMGNIYKGRIVYVLSGIHYEESILNEEGIMKHNIKPGLFPIHMKWFRDERKFFDYMNNNYQICKMDTTCEDIAAVERNIAVLRSQIIMQYRNKDYIGEDGRLQLIRLPNPTMIVHFMCFFLPGQSVFPQINQYTHYLLQNGIISKIISKYSLKIPAQNRKFYRRVLTMQLLKWLFVLWLVGLIASCVIFTLEITRSLA